jgi:hypothetical protein
MVICSDNTQTRSPALDLFLSFLSDKEDANRQKPRIQAILAATFIIITATVVAHSHRGTALPFH